MPPTRFRLPRTPFVTTLVACLAGVLVAGLGPVNPATAGPTGALAEATERRGERTVKVATLNILGSNHTRGGDRRRTVRTARLIERRSVGLIGLQEVQQDQLRVLRTKLERYRVWPGLKFDARGVRLQIAWSRNRFKLLDHGTITTTFSHQRRPIPWVRLRDRDTRRRLTMIDIHNSPQNQEGARDSATRQQIRLFKRLRKRGPVLMVGDANEREEWFCKVAGGTDARAANGGSHGKRGCRPPQSLTIDWLMGGGGFGWRRYKREDVPTSDHALHTAKVRFG